MFNPVREMLTFLKYWYFRYTLVTELYMVEQWERKFVNILLVTLFVLFFYFNYKIFVPATQQLMQS